MEELNGIIVMVDPSLTNDPNQRQGQTGILVASDLENDEHFVSFGKMPIGLYSSQAILMLQNHNTIYSHLMANRHNMETNDFKTMLRVSMLTDRGTNNQLIEAFKLVADNPNTLSLGTVSLRDYLNLSISNDNEIDRPITFSR
jgi:hypothetical protein